jgi:hypothetical protein
MRNTGKENAVILSLGDTTEVKEKGGEKFTMPEFLVADPLALL